MTRLRDLHQRWLENPDDVREYDALEEEFRRAERSIAASQANSIEPQTNAHDDAERPVGPTINDGGERVADKTDFKLYLLSGPKVDEFEISRDLDEARQNMALTGHRRRLPQCRHVSGDTNDRRGNGRSIVDLWQAAASGRSHT